MRGQIFALGAVSVAIALFAFFPVLEGNLFLPEANTHQLENMAREFNYWLAYASIDAKSQYGPEYFGKFVKPNYPHVEFFYIFVDDPENDIYFSNFFDEPLNFSFGGRGYSVAQNETKRLTFQGDVELFTEFVDISYSPENDISGAIFLRFSGPGANIEKFEFFR